MTSGTSAGPAPDLSSLAPLREVIARHDLWAKKKLGQHFLLDLNITGRIARSAQPLDQGTVIEIGPGPGGLTRALLEAGANHLVAVEKDPRCLAALQEIETLSAGRLQVVEADALNRELRDLGPAPRRIVANLPYNVATPLLVQWLRALDRDPSAFDVLVLMFQSEVADRLAAVPGAKSFGRLSVLTQWLCHVELLFQLPGRAFTPPPKVASAIVRLTPRAPGSRQNATFEILEQVTAAAFGQRRKMLRQSLKRLLPDPVALLQSAAIDETRRAETLGIEEFCNLTRAYEAL